jgi:Protein of unknown function (DUF3300)
MKARLLQARPTFGGIRGAVALLCALLLVPGDLTAYAQSPPQQDASQEQAAAPPIPADQLDSLVAPIALYPDPLLAQVLAASTYPLEIIQLQQWLTQHKDLKDKALVDAVEKQDWDPSVQAMAPLPDALKQLADNIKWTTDLGNAFLAQQNDVMDAVQRMRMKAQGAGNLKSTEQQKVETKTVENKTVVVIEQAQPQVIYVPSYNPVVVYGPPVYPYPPIVYPPAGAYVAGMAISFGVGLAIGAAWGGGGWGYNCGWGHSSNVTINHHNTFISNSNRTNINRPSQLPSGGGNNWQHNVAHRGGTPYSNRATATKYGGTARGGSGGRGGARPSQGQLGGGGRGQAGARPSQGQLGGGRGQAGTMDRGGLNRQPSASNRAGGGGADRIGNRSVPSGGSSRGTGAFGGGAGGDYSKNTARESSSRGASSMGSRGGGGGASRGGGSRGGGRRR